VPRIALPPLLFLFVAVGLIWRLYQSRNS